ncbi:MAG: (2Fe-2S) ferredoxin domain-containing protein [Kofleriaceae bacterium]|nr:(2Fe-2S) ferredoxin domain-containing protein [Myxococcales bacterium]MCB9563824.1 (2Fe-2S) ferredoxin domain-containing protein [Kofleriaceae bacterium]MCB9573577.1 (2Fe-2S) ferredoxin domain-containing protein [Kofleriaceae bacterium]
MSERRYHITVCRGPECGDRRGSRALYEAFLASVAAHRLAHRCQVRWQSCFGRCTQGPNVLVREVTPEPPGPTPENGAAASPRATALYNAVDAVNVDEVVSQHVGAGVVVRALIQPPSLLGSRALSPSGSRR